MSKKACSVCGKNASVTRDGVKYCLIHDPEGSQAKREVRNLLKKEKGGRK